MFYNEKVDGLYQNAHGPIPYNLMNDYMFRVVLQENKFVLKGLIGSLLNLEQSEIKSVEIKNPIKLGDQIDDKTFYLDIEILLNSDTCLNLEMQVLNEGDWIDRSLSYLCRAYDDLQHGYDYNMTKRAIHIGILDFTLFKDYPEFYASYKLLNVKNHHVYSDKFVLNVLDLNQIKLATDEDRLCELDHWAKLFKAKTWEDLRMIAEQNQYMKAAAEEMYVRNADEEIRAKCQAREDYYRRQRRIQHQLEQLEDQKRELAEKDQTIDDQQQTIDDLQQAIADQQQTIAQITQERAEDKKLIAELQAKLRNR